jgi:dienelactone hydrolase
MRRLFLAALFLVATSSASAMTREDVSFPPAAATNITKTFGKLYKPDGAGPFPAVVILHGCGGHLENSDDWAKLLVKNGYAALTTDHFSPRGVKSICEDFVLVPQRDRRADTFGALQYLAGRNDIDAKKIGVMGFSNGGYSSLSAVIGKPLGVGDARFAAAVPVYPGCASFTGFALTAPTLILVGEADDWTPAEACRRLVEKLPSGSAPATLITYPDASHSFDQVDQKPMYLPNAFNPNASGGRGAHIGYNPAATTAARRDALAFFDTHLKGR